MAYLLGFVPVLYDAAGDVFRFYDFWWYDVIAHFLGSAAAAGIVFAFFRVLRRTNFVNWYLGTRMFFAFTTAVALGVLFELEEFGEDLLTCYHRDLIPFSRTSFCPAARDSATRMTRAPIFLRCFGGNRGRFGGVGNSYNFKVKISKFKVIEYMEEILILIAKFISLILGVAIVLLSCRRLPVFRVRVFFCLSIAGFCLSAFFFSEEGAFLSWIKHFLFYGGQISFLFYHPGDENLRRA